VPRAPSSNAGTQGETVLKLHLAAPPPAKATAPRITVRGLDSCRCVMTQWYSCHAERVAALGGLDTEQG
jgi:hypothetical protein